MARHVLSVQGAALDQRADRARDHAGRREAACSPSPRPRRDRAQGRAAARHWVISTAGLDGRLYPTRRRRQNLIREHARGGVVHQPTYEATSARAGSRPRRGASARTGRGPGQEPRASTASTAILTDLSPPSFVAGSLRDDLRSSASRSFHPAVVGTCEPRSAAGARAQATRAGVRRRARAKRARSAEVSASRASPADAPRRRGARARAGWTLMASGGGRRDGAVANEATSARVRRTRRTNAGAAAEDAVAKESVVQQVHRRHPRVDRFNCRGRRCAGICCAASSPAADECCSARTLSERGRPERKTQERKKNTGRHPSRSVARRVSPSPRASPRLPS